MSYTPSTRVRNEITMVRDLTTDDTTILDDVKIGQFLFMYQTLPQKARVYRAAADALQYCMRTVDWDNNKLLDASFSKSLLPDRIKEFRKIANTSSLKVH